MLHKLVDSHGGDQLLVLDGLPVLQGNGVSLGIDLRDLAILSKGSILLWQSVRDGDPDTTGTISGGESESVVGPPVAGRLF